MSSGRLKDRIVVVIGGTTGLGLSAAQSIVREDGRVVVVGRNADNVDAAAQILGVGGAALAGDATNADTAERAIQTALDQFGGFHALYHVAGGSGRRLGDGPLHEISDGGWRDTLRLNLDSVFYSNRAATQEFLKQGTGGTILNMASVLAYSPSPRHFGTHAYAAAKAAIIGLTRSSAAWYAPHNIRFNAIAPGLVDTPMAARARTSSPIQQFIHTKQPLDGGRIGVPEDLDSAALFFLSEESRFVTGQVLAVDGGWDVAEGQYAVDVEG